MVPSISTSASLPIIATSSSRWNCKAVTVILGLTALGILFYKLFTHYILTSSTSTKKASSSFSTTPFTSMFTYEKASPVNEIKLPPFKHFASGILQFNSRLNISDPLVRIVYKEENEDINFNAIVDVNNPNCFIHNLPLGKEITINFKADREERAIILKIEQPVGLYTITQNDNGELSSELVIPIDLKIPNLSYETKLNCVEADLFDLKQALVIELNDESTNIKGEENQGFQLKLTNSGERSLVIYMLLVSKSLSVDAAKRAVALPVFIYAGKTVAFSLHSLETFWMCQYEQTTKKNSPDDLQLHLGSYRILFSLPQTQEAATKVESAVAPLHHCEMVGQSWTQNW